MAIWNMAEIILLVYCTCDCNVTLLCIQEGFVSIFITLTMSNGQQFAVRKPSSNQHTLHGCGYSQTTTRTVMYRKQILVVR